MQSMKEKTIDFYNINAASYFNSTVGDMSEAYIRFIKFVKPQGLIMDIGAGSGRDIKHFMKAGFEVYGIDASEELCRISTEYTGTIIRCQKIQDWKPRIQYDGVWANASLMHLPLKDVDIFIQRLPRILSEAGVLYISLKEGLCEGIDEEGRYFNGLSIDGISSALSTVKEFSILESWVSEDTLSRGNIKWRNIIIGKQRRNEHESEGCRNL